MLPQFRPEDKGEIQGSSPSRPCRFTLTWAPTLGSALRRLCGPMLGALPRARIRGPNRNLASPRDLRAPTLPCLHPSPPATRIPPGTHHQDKGSEGGHATGALLRTAAEPRRRVTARSRRPRAPPPGRGGENAGRPRWRRRADPWRPEDGATAHCARPDGRRAGVLAALAAHRPLLLSGPGWLDSTRTPRAPLTLAQPLNLVGAETNGHSTVSPP